MEDQWRSFDNNVLKVGLTMSSQSFFDHFTHGFSGGLMSVSFGAQSQDIKKRW